MTLLLAIFLFFFAFATALSACSGTVTNEAALLCDTAENVTLNTAFAANESLVALPVRSITGTLRLNALRLPLTALHFPNLAQVRAVVLDGGLLHELRFPNVSRCDSLALAVTVPPSPSVRHTLVDLPLVDALLNCSATGFVDLQMPALASVDSLRLGVDGLQTALPSLKFVLRDASLSAKAPSDAISLPKLSSVAGGLAVAGGSVSLAALDSVGREFSVKNASLDAPRLASVGASLLWHPPTVSLPLLAQVGGSLCFQALWSANLPLLAVVGSAAAAAGESASHSSMTRCSTSSDMVSLSGTVDTDAVLHMPSLTTVHGRFMIYMHSNASLVQRSLTASALFVECRNVTQPVDLVDLSGGTFHGGFYVSCRNVSRIELGGALSVRGNATLILASIDNVYNFSRLSTNDTNARCHFELPDVCRDEAFALAGGWHCEAAWVVGHDRCFTCGNGVLNFGELADCGPSRGCLKHADCQSLSFDAPTCKCLVVPGADDGSAATAAYASVAAVAGLCVIGGAVGLLVWRRRRRSLGQMRRL